MEKITILIADDHTLVRETGSFILNTDERFQVIAECGSGEEAVELAKQLRPNIPTKSGLMLGLGETNAEALSVMRDLHAHNVDILTLGQYLRPSQRHLPILRYVPVQEFAELRNEGMRMGFAHIEAGPLVRSSYHADGAL